MYYMKTVVKKLYKHKKHTVHMSLAVYPLRVPYCGTAQDPSWEQKFMEYPGFPLFSLL